MKLLQEDSIRVINTGNLGAIHYWQRTKVRRGDTELLL